MTLEDFEKGYSEGLENDSGPTGDPRDQAMLEHLVEFETCLLYTSPSPRDGLLSRMPSSA